MRGGTVNVNTASPGIILDMRSLQDANYAMRGVGRHALALVRHAAARGGLRLIGLVDSDLPPLSVEVGDLLAETVPNAYAATARGQNRPACFVSLSPMTHDPLWTARLMADARLLRAAVVYDFIPRRAPERYLPTEAARLGYATALNWLARADIFAPISRSAAQDLRALLGTPGRDIVVTGAPVDPLFERVRDQGRGPRLRHVLVVGGGDPRKNPETVVRAHARAAALQRGAGVPLVVAGNYGAQDVDAFRAMAAALGGRPDLVEVPGHVSEAALLDIYAGAAVIVCASHDEGFSLPVVEGMAAGLPCLASDIPAHRELVEDAGLRFPANDDAALTPLLERAMVDAAWRQASLARQAPVWPRFRAAEVGRRFWDAVLGRMDGRRTPGPAPAVLLGRRPRVALLSPLPPDRSGVADYTAATCPELGRLVDLHVFSETEAPTPIPGIAGHRPLTALPHLMPGFDRVVSVVGNSHFHLRIFDLLHRFGAACIAHDARMLGFYRILLGLDRTLATASLEVGRPVAEAELNGWLGDEGTTRALLLGDIAQMASPMIVHSPVTARFMRARHGVEAAYVPFTIYRPWTAAELGEEARIAARARLGLARGEIAIATFGFVQQSKGPEECVWALSLLRGWGLPASLHFVGGVDLQGQGASLVALISRLGLAGNVRFADDSYASEQTYRDYLVGSDLGIQIRMYGLGGLSGALIDCAAAGLPTVTNASLLEAVGVPESYIRAVPDAISPLLLAEALAGLVEQGAGATRLHPARHAFSEERSLRAYARRLCDALGLPPDDRALRGRSEPHG